MPSKNALVANDSTTTDLPDASAATDHALAQFEKAAGGRSHLAETLAFATLDQRGDQLLRLLGDPARARLTLGNLCREVGMTPGQLLQLFRSSAFAKAATLAMGTLTTRLPEVVEDVMDKAKDGTEPCFTCAGTGKTTEQKDCTVCRGTGHVFRRSDIDRQRLAFEAAGLVKKGGGLNIQVNQTNQSVPPPNFSTLMKTSDTVAYHAMDDDLIDATTTGD